MQVMPLLLQHMQGFFPGFEADELMRIYGATGGIPFYLRFFDPDKSFYENVEHAIFSKEAVLYAEGDFLLREELREPATYMNILYSISKGATRAGEIAAGVGVGSAQVRKDLAYFGEFGTRGVGYKVSELYGHLIKILGLNQTWNVIIIGAGKLGSALALYKGFNDRGFKVRAVLDTNQDIIGEKLADIVVEPLEVMKERILPQNIKVGIIPVPAQAAQQVSDKLLEAGVMAILNFSPEVLRVPSGVILRNVDLSVNLEVLSFNLSFNS